MHADTLTDSSWVHSAQQGRSQRTLERILAATERLMARRPFREISVADIVREAKASISSFYARFPDKEALLGCIYERHARSQIGLIDELLTLDRWRDVPLAVVLRRVFPMIVAGYRERQGLIRAFLERASADQRFRDAWGQLGSRIAERIIALVEARRFEVDHPDPRSGVRHGLAMVFATLVHQIQMHRIDEPEMDQLVEELTRMMLRYMGIQDVIPQRP